MKPTKQPEPDIPVVERGEYREILLARMAGGDLYANEERMKFRRVDMLFDRFRERPIYSEEEKRREWGVQK